MPPTRMLLHTTMSFIETTAASVVFGMIVGYLVMAGILFAIFNAAMGGDASYKKVLTVLVHSAVISAVSAASSRPSSGSGSTREPASTS